MNKIVRVGIGVLVMNQQNEVLLGQRLQSHGSSMWAPPGGNLEFGETFEDCAIRETKEETALIITKPRFLYLTNDIFEKEDKHYISIVMCPSYPPGQSIVNLEPHKTKDWKWFNLSRLPSNLFPSLHPLRNHDFDN